MRKRLIAAGLGALALAGCGTAMEGTAAVAAAPKLEVLSAVPVRQVHLRKLERGGVDIDPPTQLNVVIGRRDAPVRWRAAWGGDGSLRWADRQLDWMGCDVHQWHGGAWVVGLDCDY